MFILCQVLLRLLVLFLFIVVFIYLFHYISFQSSTPPAGGASAHRTPVVQRGEGTAPVPQSRASQCLSRRMERRAAKVKHGERGTRSQTQQVLSEQVQKISLFHFLRLFPLYLPPWLYRQPFLIRSGWMLRPERLAGTAEWNKRDGCSLRTPP